MKLKFNKKKEIKNLKTSMRYFAFFGIGMLSMLGLILFAFTTTANDIHSHVGCDGADLFYTGKGFLYDVADIDLNQNGFMGYPAYTPRVYHDQRIGDCKTVSNAIYCLGKLYNVTCSFYTQVTYDPTAHYDNWISGADWQDSLKFNGHMGVKCYFEDEWRAFY
jgi:hypothetical protein